MGTSQFKILIGGWWLATRGLVIANPTSQQVSHMRGRRERQRERAWCCIEGMCGRASRNGVGNLWERGVCGSPTGISSQKKKSKKAAETGSTGKQGGLRFWLCAVHRPNGPSACAQLSVTAWLELGD